LTEAAESGELLALVSVTHDVGRGIRVADRPSLLSRKKERAGALA